MARVFRECLDNLFQAKGQFEPNEYPLSKLENLTAEEREGGLFISAHARKEAIIAAAEKKFNRTHRTMYDFYGCLFDVLRDERLSTSDGIEAASMFVIYHNTMRLYPMFKALSFPERYKVMREACKNTRKNEKNMKGYAMRMYLALVANGLDKKVYLPDEIGVQKGSYDSPWRAKSGLDPAYKLYIKVFQNYKKLADYDSSWVSDPHFPVWTKYRPKEDYHGINRTMLAVDLWCMLAETKSK